MKHALIIIITVIFCLQGQAKIVYFVEDPVDADAVIFFTTQPSWADKRVEFISNIYLEDGCSIYITDIPEEADEFWYQSEFRTSADLILFETDYSYEVDEGC
jgi:hypothetical protein